MKKLIAAVATAVALTAPVAPATAAAPTRTAHATERAGAAACCLDEVLCPMFRQLHAIYGNIPGVFEITDDGDVYVMGEWVWNCPPY